MTAGSDNFCCCNLCTDAADDNSRQNDDQSLSILIIGGGGGVGSIAIQLAKNLVNQSSFESSSRIRYGDYFGAAIDPLPDQPVIWVAGEYVSENIT
jgi:NADPH:quinone reductase-like Zn-dependent oxidoreductase